MAAAQLADFSTERMRSLLCCYVRMESSIVVFSLLLGNSRFLRLVAKNGKMRPLHSFSPMTIFINIENHTGIEVEDD